MPRKNILVIAAHPDDEILGCGATMSLLSKRGNNILTLILGEGITSRDEVRSPEKRAAELRMLRKQATAANKIVGVKNVFSYDFPDNRFDSVPLLDIVKVIEKVKRKVKPDIIFTHYKEDLNVDHRITYAAVLTAARPLPKERIKGIYSFEVNSTTEYGYPLTFSPDIFYDVSKTFKYKLEAMKVYKGEMKRFPHPRSAQGVKITAQNWGLKVGLGLAEAFKLVRDIR